jgi:hypothetical protein
MTQYQAFLKAHGDHPSTMTEYFFWCRERRSEFHRERGIDETPPKGWHEAEYMNWLVLAHNDSYHIWLALRYA